MKARYLLEKINFDIFGTAMTLLTFKLFQTCTRMFFKYAFLLNILQTFRPP